MNKLWGRRGKVFPERYHDEVISTPTQLGDVYVAESAGTPKKLTTFNDALFDSLTIEENVGYPLVNLEGFDLAPDQVRARLQQSATDQGEDRQEQASLDF